MVSFFSNGWVQFLIYLAWILPWKGYALWKAANRKETVWFIIMLILNTVGVLEILYIFVFSNDKILENIKKN